MVAGGVSIKTWQGAVYLACVLILLVGIQLLPLNTTTRMYVTGAWLASSSWTCLMLCGR